MTRPLDILDNIRIASPCTVTWDSMTGDDRVRFCGQCNLHVYNLSEMRREEAVALVTRAAGTPCLRLYRRRDGTVLTDDCPVGLRWIRKRARRVAAAVAGFLGVAIGTGSGCIIAAGKPIYGRVDIPKVSTSQPTKQQDAKKQNYQPEPLDRLDTRPQPVDRRVDRGQ